MPIIRHRAQNPAHLSTINTAALLDPRLSRYDARSTIQSSVLLPATFRSCSTLGRLHCGEVCLPFSKKTTGPPRAHQLTGASNPRDSSSFRKRPRLPVGEMRVLSMVNGPESSVKRGFRGLHLLQVLPKFRKVFLVVPFMKRLYAKTITYVTNVTLTTRVCFKQSVSAFSAKVAGLVNGRSVIEEVGERRLARSVYSWRVTGGDLRSGGCQIDLTSTRRLEIGSE